MHAVIAHGLPCLRMLRSDGYSRREIGALVLFDFPHAECASGTLFFESGQGSLSPLSLHREEHSSRCMDSNGIQFLASRVVAGLVSDPAGSFASRLIREVAAAGSITVELWLTPSANDIATDARLPVLALGSIALLSRGVSSSSCQAGDIDLLLVQRGPFLEVPRRSVL